MKAARSTVALEPDVLAHEEFARGLDRGEFLLVDVLPEESYRNGHIPGALHLPAAELERLAPALIPDRGAEIVVYCSGFS